MNPRDALRVWLLILAAESRCGLPTDRNTESSSQVNPLQVQRSPLDLQLSGTFWSFRARMTSGVQMSEPFHGPVFR